jgi:hypothetical protein
MLEISFQVRVYLFGLLVVAKLTQLYYLCAGMSIHNFLEYLLVVRPGKHQGA